MLRRAFVLLFVAWLFGALGVGVGVLFAPADGTETRAAVAAFIDEHGGTFGTIAGRSREAIKNAVDYVMAAAEL